MSEKLPSLPEISSDCSGEYLLHQLCYAAMKLTPNDWERGGHIVEQWIYKHDLLSRVLRPLAQIACKRLVQDAGRTMRPAYWRDVTPIQTWKEDGLVAVAALDLMAYPMRNGVPIGKCTKSYILEEGRYFIKVGKNHIMKGVWFTLVGKSLKTMDSLPETELTSKTLAQLQDRAKRKVKE